jgi:hypothetical protein
LNVRAGQLTVMKNGGDVVDLGRNLQAAVARLRAASPVGAEIHAVSDQPAVVQSSVHEFTKSLFEAILIVLGVSFVSLGCRTGIVAALSTPLVLAMSFLAMYTFGIDLQRISLGALIIALGLLVDDAIIAVEMIALKLEQAWDRVRAATFAYTTTASPMLTGTLINVAALIEQAAQLAQSLKQERCFASTTSRNAALPRQMGRGCGRKLAPSRDLPAFSIWLPKNRNIVHIDHSNDAPLKRTSHECARFPHSRFPPPQLFPQRRDPLRGMASNPVGLLAGNDEGPC